MEEYNEEEGLINRFYSYLIDNYNDQYFDIDKIKSVRFDSVQIELDNATVNEKMIQCALNEITDLRNNITSYKFIYLTKNGETIRISRNKIIKLTNKLR